MLFWRGCPCPGQTTLEVQGKATRELLFDGNWPVCWAQHCKACCHHKNDGKSSWSHSPWVGQGRSWVMGKGIYRYNITVDTLGHNDAIYHISFFLPDFSAGFMGRLFMKSSLVHCDLIRYSLNITRCINYHCCTRATEEVKCFSFAWTESICLKCSQYH